MHCRKKYGGTPLLASTHLNVLVPTLDDLAASLPSSWQHSECNISIDGRHPSSQWLEQFWTLMAARTGNIPASLRCFAVVPIARNRLASFEHCLQHQALSQAHLAALPSFAANSLAAVGCICITENRAHRASPIPHWSEPLTIALDATSRRLGLLLQHLLSHPRLGGTELNAVRLLLAEHVHITGANHATIWQTLCHCPIFEDVTGSMTTLPDSSGPFA